MTELTDRPTGQTEKIGGWTLTPSKLTNGSWTLKFKGPEDGKRDRTTIDGVKSQMGFATQKPRKAAKHADGNAQGGEQSEDDE